jgi:hypothetical protein
MKTVVKSATNIDPRSGEFGAITASPIRSTPRLLPAACWLDKTLGQLEAMAAPRLCANVVRPAEQQ